MTKITMTKSGGNVFADLGFSSDQAQNLQLRSKAMMAIAKWFEQSAITQAVAAKMLGITQPRLNQLLKGKISEFSLDALVNMATLAGMRVGLTIKPVPAVKLKPAAKLAVSKPSTKLRKVA
jgi:predicted XRE-type DNA-binding protein